MLSVNKYTLRHSKYTLTHSKYTLTHSKYTLCLNTILSTVKLCTLKRKIIHYDTVKNNPIYMITTLKITTVRLQMSFSLFLNWNDLIWEIRDWFSFIFGLGFQRIYFAFQYILCLSFRPESITHSIQFFLYRIYLIHKKISFFYDFLLGFLRCCNFMNELFFWLNLAFNFLLQEALVKLLYFLLKRRNLISLWFHNAIMFLNQQIHRCKLFVIMFRN